MEDDSFYAPAGLCPGCGAELELRVRDGHRGPLLYEKVPSLRVGWHD